MASVLQIPLSLEETPWEEGTSGRLESIYDGETIHASAFERIEDAFTFCSEFMDRQSSVEVLNRSWLPDLYYEFMRRCNMSLHYALHDSPWKPFFTPIQRISIGSELAETIRENKHLNEILNISIPQILYTLQQEESLIHIFYERDVDVPKWKEVVISVYVKERSYEEKMRLWELIEEKVRTKIEYVRKQLPRNERRKIDRLNEKLSIRVRELGF